MCFLKKRISRFNTTLGYRELRIRHATLNTAEHICLFDRFVFWRFAKDLYAIQTTQVNPIFTMSFDGTYSGRTKYLG